MPAETSTPTNSSNTNTNNSGSDSHEESCTPEQLRDGVTLTAGPDVTTIKVTGVSGKPR